MFTESWSHRVACVGRDIKAPSPITCPEPDQAAQGPSKALGTLQPTLPHSGPVLIPKPTG